MNQGERKAREGMVKSCTLTSALTARPIAKGNVLVCTAPVLIITKYVLVRVVGTYVIYECVRRMIGRARLRA